MEKFQDIHVIPAPFLASTEEMAGKFLSEPSIKDILELAKFKNISLLVLAVFILMPRLFRKKK